MSAKSDGIDETTFASMSKSRTLATEVVSIDGSSARIELLELREYAVRVTRVRNWALTRLRARSVGVVSGSNLVCIMSAKLDGFDETACVAGASCERRQHMFKQKMVRNHEYALRIARVCN